MNIKIWFKRKLRRMRDTGHFISGGIAVCLAILLIISLGFSTYRFILLPKIDLKGKNTVVLDYKEKYKEKGYKASFLGKDISDDVVISGKVNTKKLGTYKIVYKVRDGIFSRKIVRKVIVKDLEKPKIDTTKDDFYVCPGEDPVAPEVKANDNYDGDLSEKVKSTISNDKLYYRVTDSSGNTREVFRNIVYKDKEKPQLTLIGQELVYIFVGENYKDDFVKVSDNCDKELDKAVKVNNGVDISKAGDYKVVYSIKDKAGNENSITRRVKVSERGRNGTIYLTFDDGPNSGTTDVILDILKSEGVKATFFVTNRGPDELIKREYDEGHTVALHTASHDYGTIYSSVDAYFNDLYSVQSRVKKITGYESKIIRFPGGSSNTISRRYSQGIMTKLTNEVVNRGFRYYDWNLSSGDAEGGRPTADYIYNRVVNSLSHDRVNMVLMHDIKPYTRDALSRIIKYGKNNGYTFEKITMGTEMIKQRVNN